MSKEATQEKEVQVNKHYIRAAVDSATINKKDRTVDVTFATDTPVLSFDWELGDYYEVLSFEPGHIRTERINASAPVLDMHRKYVSVKDGEYLGVVVPDSVKFDFVAKKARATLKFSKHEDLNRVWQDIEDGILSNLSVGYDVYTYRETGEIKKNSDQIRTLVAVDWEPKEISVVLIPADIYSGIERSEENIKKTHKARILIDNTMNKEQIKAERERSAKIIEATEKAQLPSSFARTLIENDEATVDKIDGLVSAEKERVATEKKGARTEPEPEDKEKDRSKTDPAKPATTENERIADDATKNERFRQSQIRTAMEKARMQSDEDVKFMNELIDKGTPLDGARMQIMERFMAQDPHTGSRSLHVGKEDTEKKREIMETALLLRANPSLRSEEETANKERVAATREFRGLDLMDMAREHIRAAGGKTEGMSKQEVAQAAMNRGERSAGVMSTSDFPIILGNVVDRVLRRAYELYPQTYKAFSRQSSFKDFREKTLVQLGDIIDEFKPVAEGGEYKYSKMGEAKETYKPTKYGQIIAISWETLINDDLDAFSRIPTAIAQRAAQKESDIVWGILTGNPLMGDGNALFSTEHENTGTTGNIDVAKLDEMFTKFAEQTGLSGNDTLNLSPAFVMVPPSMRLLASQYIGANAKSMLATKGADINPAYIRDLELVIEPRLKSFGWFGAADPGMIDTIEYAYLEGENGLFTERRNGFDVDGVEIKARLVFGAKAIDHRGLYRNTTAA